jgi:hypothetical protein
MWIACCSNAPAEHVFHWAVLKSSKIPQVWTRRAREPCLAKRKICLAPQNRDDISVGQSLTRGEILDLTTAKIAQQFCLSDRFDNLCAINYFMHASHVFGRSSRFFFTSPRKKNAGGFWHASTSRKRIGNSAAPKVRANRGDTAAEIIAT